MKKGSPFYPSGTANKKDLGHNYKNGYFPFARRLNKTPLKIRLSVNILHYVKAKSNTQYLIRFFR
jgi:hypothetical protein